MSEKVLLLGASSFVGECCIRLLVAEHIPVVALSRQSGFTQKKSKTLVKWHHLPNSNEFLKEEKLSLCICVAPVWVLQQHFKLLEKTGIKRIVALSSTSRFTKLDSSDESEKMLAERLIKGEQNLQNWAEKNNIEWTILRPTLIYGLGRDKNVTEIATFFRRFGFFPVFGSASGKRQPIYVKDVARLCLAAAFSPKAINKAYNIAGGEVLSYHEMVRRIFLAMRRKPRVITIPLFVFRVSLLVLHLLPGYRHWSISMAERMNRDQVFDSSEAISDLGVTPGPFLLRQEDVHLV